MTKRIKVTLFSAGLALASSPLFAAGEAPHIPHLSRKAAIEIANAAAADKGFDLTQFDAPVVHWEFVKKDRSWDIIYQGKVRAAGNFFSVTVEDSTRATKVYPGE